MLKRQIGKSIIVFSLCVCLALVTFMSSTFAPKALAAIHHPASCVSYAGTQISPLADYFYPGDAWTAFTCSGKPVELTFQTDNNLVLYINGAAKWSSQTYFTGPEIKPDYVEFQPDGNLVVYSYVLSGNYYYVKALWASNTNGEGATSLNLQEDGNLVIYRNSTALWASNTCCYS